MIHTTVFHKNSASQSTTLPLHKSLKRFYPNTSFGVSMVSSKMGSVDTFFSKFGTLGLLLPGLWFMVTVQIRENKYCGFYVTAQCSWTNGVL